MERDRLTPTELEMDAAISAALDDFPLAPLPPGFVAATIQRITPTPRFQLQFLDLALPFLCGVLFLTLLAGFGWLSGLLAPSWLPAPAGVPQDFLATLNQLPLQFLILTAIAAGAALVMVGTVYVALWLDRPLIVRAPESAHGRM